MSDLLRPGDHRAGALFTADDVLDAMVEVEAAWSSALAGARIAPDGARVPASELRELLGDAERTRIAVDAEAGGNPVIGLVATLRAGLGDSTAATWLHRGLTSQDVLDTAMMLCAARAFAAIAEQLGAQATSLVELCDAHRHTPMVGRTLTQYAVPVPFGLKVAGWLSGVLDAVETVGAMRFSAQFGGAAGTFAAAVELAGSLDDPAAAALDAAAHAGADLGLDAAVPWHTVRTAVTRCGDAAVRCTDAWGHLANDVLTLSRPEIGELSEGVGGGSSTMPHKANPVLSALIRRTALSAPPMAASLHLAAADSCDERSAGAWHSEWPTLRDLLRSTAATAGQVTDLLHGLRVHTDRMTANLAAAGDDVRAEQRAMAALAGHPPAAEYLGTATEFIDMVLHRAAAVDRAAPERQLGQGVSRA